MMTVVLVLLGLLLVTAFALYVVATRRIAKATGAPTPEEAKIEAKTKAEAIAIVNEGEKQKAEVANASTESLVARVRNRLRGK